MDKLIPFLVMAVGPNGGKAMKLNFARISELAVAIVTILYFMNITVTKMEVKLDNVQTEVKEIKAQVHVLDARLYEHDRVK